ncbi:hypothetical protein EII33_05685 [Bacteroides heparinolyticus]|uniref:Uncharacterized protein n=1 Tax=Prevotella heparinolytica TaxID=28113 RepID=A0A3P2AAK2_9BACE|nr:hypothetical protein [Bacteroides heparinolyticus]RRD91988.1 hypothetical protein EII33_05685 [Bacteroides heparinolyticus]
MSKKDILIAIIINIGFGVFMGSILSAFFSLDGFAGTYVSLGIAVMSSCFTIIYHILKDQRSFLEKIEGDLIKTHAIVVPNADKLLITAKFIKFHDPEDYASSEDFSECIDLIRTFTYQDLIFSPKYLFYFFNRIKQPGTHFRIIVIGEACQASLTYVVLSCLAGYETYVISDKNFNDFRKRHRIDKNKKLQDIFKGNPYLKKKGTLYEGKFSTYQPHDETPTVNKIEDELKIDIYNYLLCLKNNYCTNMNPRIEVTTNINDFQAILNTKINGDKCCQKKQKSKGFLACMIALIDSMRKSQI